MSPHPDSQTPEEKRLIAETEYYKKQKKKLGAEKVKIVAEICGLFTIGALFFLFAFYQRPLKWWCKTSGVADCVFFNYKLTIEDKDKALQAENDIDSALATLKELKAKEKLSPEESQYIDRVVSILQNARQGINSITEKVTATDGKWAVVLGSSSTYNSALKEKNIADEKNYGTVKIYKHGNWFKYAIEYENKELAYSKYNSKIKSDYSAYGAYPSPLENLCPNMKNSQDGKYFDCD